MIVFTRRRKSKIFQREDPYTSRVLRLDGTYPSIMDDKGSEESQYSAYDQSSSYEYPMEPRLIRGQYQSHNPYQSDGGSQRQYDTPNPIQLKRFQSNQHESRLPQSQDREQSGTQQESPDTQTRPCTTSLTSAAQPHDGRAEEISTAELSGTTHESPTQKQTSRHGLEPCTQWKGSRS